MIALSRLLWESIFPGENPPGLISLGLPSLEERRRLIDETRAGIDNRELIIRRLEIIAGCTPENFSAGLQA